MEETAVAFFVKQKVCRLVLLQFQFILGTDDNYLRQLQANEK